MPHFDHTIENRSTLKLALDRSEERFRLLVQTLPHGILECDTDGVIAFCNSSCAKMHGFKESELLGKRIWELLDDESEQDDLQKFLANLAMEQPDPQPYISTNRTKDGNTIDVQIDWNFRRDERGNVTGIFSVVTDITQRRELPQIYQDAPVGLCHFDTQLRYLDINEWLANLNGLSVEEHLGRTVSELFPKSASGIESQLLHVLETGESICDGSVFIETPARSNEKRYFEHHYVAVKSEGGTIVGVSCTVEEITKSKQAEETLHQTEQDMIDLFENATVGLHCVGQDGMILKVNRAELELLGYKKEEYVGHHIEEFHHDKEAINDIHARLTNHETLKDYEANLICKDGSIKTVLIDSNVLYRNGNFIHTRCFSRDITAQKQTEKALITAYDYLETQVAERTRELHKINSRLKEEIDVRKRTEEELKLSAEMIENMAEGVCLLRASDGCLVFTNPRFDEIFGYDPRELFGQHSAMLIAPGEHTPKATADKILKDLEKNGNWSGEVKNIRKDGRIIWTHSSVSTFEHALHGTVRVASVEDITEKKNNERALFESEKRLRDILDSLFGFVGLFTTDGILVEANRAPLDAAGLKKEDVIGKPFWETHWWSYSGDVQEQLKDALKHAANGETVRYDVPVRVAENRLIDIDVMFGPLYDSRGVITQLLGFAVDITDRKRAMLASQEKQQQLNNLLSNVNAIILEADPFDFYFVGGQVEKILGYPKEMWFEHPQGPFGFWSKILHPDDTDKIETCIKAIEQCEDHSFEYRLLAKDGKPIWFYDSVTVESQNGKPVKTRSVMIDITERKQVEEALRRSEERFDLAVRGTSDGLWDWNMVTGEEYWSPRFKELLGYTEDEIEASFENFLEFLHPEDKQRVQQAIQEHLGHNQPYDVEFRMRKKNGEYRWFRSRGEASRDKTGKAYRVSGSMRDITNRKRVEDALRESEERYRRLTELMPVAMYTCDEQGRIMYFNEHAAAAWGRKPKIGETDKRFCGSFRMYLPDGSSLPHEKSPMSVTLKEGIVYRNCEVTIERPDGIRTDILANIDPVYDASGTIIGAINVFSDITARKRAEEEAREHLDALAHVNRVSTMGEMATGLAHELNQPLAAIAIFCHVGMQTLEECRTDRSEKLQDLFEKLSAQSTRAGEIIHRLGALVRKTEPVRLPRNVTTLVESVLELFESELRETKVGVELNFKHSPANVIIDEIQMQQVFVNLIRNALDAMCNTPVDQRVLIIGSRNNHQKTVEIFLSDAGKGIRPEDEHKIFDTFFSTKSEGMGMGLAISRSIVESHGGNLRMTRNETRGVTLRMTLPVEKESRIV